MCDLGIFAPTLGGEFLGLAFLVAAFREALFSRAMACAMVSAPGLELRNRLVIESSLSVRRGNSRAILRGA
jgi:hypothetical protein